MGDPFRDNPCYNHGNDCCDRYPGCGANCQRYKDWKSELAEEKAKIRKDKEREKMFYQSSYRKKMCWLFHNNPSTEK